MLEDRSVRLRRNPVQPADLVVRPPRALGDLDAVLLENGLVRKLFLHCCHRRLLSIRSRVYEIRIGFSPRTNGEGWRLARQPRRPGRHPFLALRAWVSVIPLDPSVETDPRK